jgi:hypothetical protein
MSCSPEKKHKNLKNICKSIRKYGSEQLASDQSWSRCYWLKEYALDVYIFYTQSTNMYRVFEMLDKWCMCALLAIALKSTWRTKVAISKSQRYNAAAYWILRTWDMETILACFVCPSKSHRVCVFGRTPAESCNVHRINTRRTQKASVQLAFSFATV